jgi:hypothetical protein
MRSCFLVSDYRDTWGRGAARRLLWMSGMGGGNSGDALLISSLN